MALALYRRYRPDTFDGIIGQDQVTVPLSHALDTGRLTHAYLFSGPRGCGKTSSARILARCINCKKGPTSHPCGECPSCKDLATGGPGSIDVVEIDAASHNGVDDARELRERAAFAPARDRYKIFILDEAHMVTQQGFNALLKIVEEPPEHVMFIFATTEPDKVISTIRSRTHHYPFRLVPEEVMGPYLEQVCEQEHIEADPGVLGLAMKAGGGSVRDTLSVLDQLMVGSVNGEISYDSAVALLGFTPDALIGEAVDAVIDGNGEALYGVIEKVVVGGFEPRRFVEDLLARVRDLLVLTLGGEQAAVALDEETASLDMADLQRQAKALGLAALTSMAGIIDSALAEMVGATSARMRLELLAARLLAARQSGFVSVALPTVSAATATAASGSATGVGRTERGTNGAGAGIVGRNNIASDGRGSSAMSGGSNPRGGFIGRRDVGPTNGSTAVGISKDGAGSGGQSVMAHTSGIPGNPASQQPAEPSTQSGALQSSGSRSSHEMQQSQGPQSQPRRTSMGQSPQTAQERPAAEPVQASPMEVAVRRKLGQIDPTASVDEKWDDVLKVLPEGVSEYVVREKVPTVALSTNAAGRSRLSMTFDSALSQHAFALAIASDAENEGRKASSVVLDTVKVVFGPGTMIAPTAVAANGEHVTSTKRMKPGELAQVKRKIAMAKAGLTTVSGIATRGNQGSEPKEQKKSSESDNGNSDDSPHVADEGNFDPWFQTPSSAGNEAVGEAPKATGAATKSLDGEGVDGSDADKGHIAGLQVPGRSKAHKKQIAVPDVSDGVDPWDMPTAENKSIREAAVVPGSSGTSANAAGGVEVDAPAEPYGAHARNGRAAPMNSGTGVDLQQQVNQAMGVQQSQGLPQPQVAPEDDDYSLSDRSLGSDAALSLDDLNRMFEVKKVEEFASDDPKNPKNAKPTSKMQNDAANSW